MVHNRLWQLSDQQPKKQSQDKASVNHPVPKKQNMQHALSNAGSYLRDPPLLELSGTKMHPEEAFGPLVGL